jgi:hypothetical protein
MKQTYDTGTFQKFHATRKFTWGNNERFKLGDTVLFDGLDAQIDGKTVRCPLLQAAVTVGWLAPPHRILWDHVLDDDPWTI